MNSPHKSEEVEAPLALATERLLLRDVEAADTDALVRYYSEPQSHANILARQRDSDYIARRIQGASLYNHHYHWREREDFVFAVCLGECSRIIGTVSLNDTVPQGRDARIGWHFGAEYAGRGFATEAAAAALRFAFESIKVGRIFGDCNETNGASIRIFTKIGMQPFEHGFLRNRLRALRYRHSMPVVRFAIDRSGYMIRADNS